MHSTDLIGTAEAAQIIGVERSTITRWVDAGRITVAHKLPGRTGATLFHRGEVQRVAAEYAADTGQVTA